MSTTHHEVTLGGQAHGEDSVETLAYRALQARVAVFAADGSILWTSQEWLRSVRMFGAVGDNLVDLLAAHTKTHPAELIRQIGDIPARATARLYLKIASPDQGDSDVITCEIRTFNGTNAHFVALLTTASESLQPSEAALDLAEGLQDLRVLFENAPIAVARIAANGQILEWNREAERLFGCARQRVVGQVIDLTWPEPEERAADAESYDRVFVRGEPVLHQRLRKRNARGIPIEVLQSIFPIKEKSGGVTRAVAMFVDQEERRRFIYDIETLSRYYLHQLRDLVAEALAIFERQRRSGELTDAMAAARSRIEQMDVLLTKSVREYVESEGRVLNRAPTSLVNMVEMALYTSRDVLEQTHVQVGVEGTDDLLYTDKMGLTDALGYIIRHFARWSAACGLHQLKVIGRRLGPDFEVALATARPLKKTTQAAMSLEGRVRSVTSPDIRTATIWRILSLSLRATVSVFEAPGMPAQIIVRLPGAGEDGAVSGK